MNSKKEDSKKIEFENRAYIEKILLEQKSNCFRSFRRSKLPRVTPKVLRKIEEEKEKENRG